VTLSDSVTGVTREHERRAHAAAPQAEEAEQDGGRVLDRRDWGRRAQANRCGSVESGLGDVKTGG
jgi:hypothetical protein